MYGGYHCTWWYTKDAWDIHHGNLYGTILNRNNIQSQIKLSPSIKRHPERHPLCHVYVLWRTSFSCAMADHGHVHGNREVSMCAVAAKNIGGDSGKDKCSTKISGDSMKILMKYEL
eukprot:1155565-Pelagomonas_calceolata.AAC.5